MIYKLNEAIEDIKKYYPNIPDDIFLQLIELDPTYRSGSSSAGKYGKWLLNLYNKGNLSEEDFSEVTPLLNQFTTYRNRIQNKDLNSYKSLDALADTLTSVIDDDSMLTPRQKVRFLKNVKSGKIKTNAEDDYDVVLDTPKFIVYVPNTHEASMNLGKGTDWCTAHENPEWYNHYTKNNGKLYIIKDKNTGERWQYSDSTEDFLDENDEEFDITNLLSQDTKLSAFFAKFMGYDVGKPYVYDGHYIPDELRNLITNIIVDDTVDIIDEDAFSYMRNLTNIQLPINLNVIDDSAFESCRSLKSIDIPSNVAIIGRDCFSDCSSLKNVDMSFGLSKIYSAAFAECTSLTSLQIPDTVTAIGEYAFYKCTNLQAILLPSDLRNINKNTFGFCEKLIVVKIPDGVKQIRDYAFYYCSSLRYVSIPDTVEFISDSAFAGCDDDLIIITNNSYVIDYCNRPDIDIKVQSLSKNESYKKPYKLHIREY